MGQSSWEEVLASVEHDEYGQPIILSRYGFRIEVHGGKRYLVAATKEDYIRAVEDRLKRKLTDEERSNPSVCLGGARGCYPGECTKQCVQSNNGGTWYCYCT